MPSFEVYNPSYFQKILKQGDGNSHVRVFAIQCCKYKTLSTLPNFTAVCARWFYGYILQNNTTGHWEVKIICLAAEGT